MIKKNDFKKAYTFAELVLAMIVLGVLITITTCITRSKIERVQKYCYYSVYTTLTSLAAEIIADSEEGLIPDDTDLCSEFESRLNLSSDDITVNGSTVTPSCSVTYPSISTDFSGLTPNLVTRNGVKFYNLSTAAVIIDILNDASLDDSDIQGFIIYVDIDGDRSSSEIYKDVFPFFITLSGKVIPAYPTDSDSDEAGGNNPDEMVCSARYDTIELDPTNSYYVRYEHWIVKSVSFQEAACKSGYVKSSTYCGSYAVDGNCGADDSDCILEPLKPVKYLVR